MPKYMAVHVVVLAGLVAAVTLLVFQSRALTFRLEKLEAARGRAESERREPASPQAPVESPAADDLKPVYIEKSGSMPLNPLNAAPAPAAPTETASELTPAQEQAVAKSVDRILKEKYGRLPGMTKPGDLEKTLEKELNLSASQKLRIAEILKWRRDELHKLFEGENPMAGPTMKKALDIERRAEEAIKGEIDATQQAKYDQLKKDGKIPQGVMIQVEAGGKDED